MKRISIISITLLLFTVGWISSVFPATGLSRSDQTIYGTKTFEHGVTVKGSLTAEGATIGLNTYGPVYYVHNSDGLDSGTWGTTYLKPFASVDYAINHASSRDEGNENVIIYVMPGHAESYTAADGFDVDLAGVSVIGLGTGQDMPEFTFADTDATIAIGAASVTLKNLRMLAGISEVVMGISIEGAGDDAVLDGIYFPEPTTSTFEFDKAIVLALGADRVTIKNCTYYNADAVGATNVIDLDSGIQSGLKVVNNFFYGEFAEGAIHSDKADMDVMIAGNVVYNLTSGQHAIEFTTTAAGVIADNRVYTDAEATSIDPGSLMPVGPNWVTTAIDASPVMYPAQDDIVQNLIGVNDADNDAETDTVAANEDGSILERLEQIQEAVNVSTGTSMASGKSIVDALGTDGSSPIDNVANVISAIGVQNADNTFVSSSIAANEDGSVMERLEQVQEVVNRGAGTSVASGKSLVDALGTDGSSPIDNVANVISAIGVQNSDNAFISTSIASNKDGSVMERLEALAVAAEPTKDHPNYINLSVDLTSGTWNSLASHEILTVAGAIRLKMMVTCTETVVSAGTTATMTIGTEGATPSIIASTIVASGTDSTQLDAGEFWVDATPDDNYVNAASTGMFDFVIYSGQDVGYAIGHEALTDGTLVFDMWWYPLNSTGSATQGAGGTL